MARRSFRNFARDGRGLVTIEFVIVLPIIFAALFLVYEFGRTFLAYEIMSDNVRDALRYLARAESVDFSATNSGYVQYAKNLAQTGNASATANCPDSYPASSSTNCHYPWTSSSTITVTTSAFSSTNYNTDGKVITMTATVPITLSFLGFIGANTDYNLIVSSDTQYIGD